MAISLPKLRLSEIALRRRSWALSAFSLASVPSLEPSSTKMTSQSRPRLSSTGRSRPSSGSRPRSSLSMGTTIESENFLALLAAVVAPLAQVHQPLALAMGIGERQPGQVQHDGAEIGDIQRLELRRRRHTVVEAACGVIRDEADGIGLQRHVLGLGIVVEAKQGARRRRMMVAIVDDQEPLGREPTPQLVDQEIVVDPSHRYA